MTRKGGLNNLWIIIGVLITVVVIWALMYNSLVSKDIAVEESWGNVQTAYQRRADLLPNLIETVREARDFEHDTLVELTALRAQAQTLKADLSDPTMPNSFKGYILELEAIADKVMLIVEDYPEIKSNENYLALQDELAGTENRIKYARDEYNEAVGGYKKATRSFPTAIVAGMYGFDSERYDMFTAQSGAEDVPSLN